MHSLSLPRTAASRSQSVALTLKFSAATSLTSASSTPVASGSSKNSGNSFHPSVVVEAMSEESWTLRTSTSSRPAKKCRSSMSVALGSSKNSGNCFPPSVVVETMSEGTWKTTLNFVTRSLRRLNNFWRDSTARRAGTRWIDRLHWIVRLARSTRVVLRPQNIKLSLQR
ncbi:hypothetical protein DFP72DRAFT_917626, partial [Ephemerocybe angulata]